MGIEDMFNNTPVDGESGDSKTARREMSRIPDGTYKTNVDDFSVFRTDKGDHYISWWFEVMDGDASGASLQRFSSITPRTIGIIKRSVKAVTGRVPEWNDLFNSETGRTGPIASDIVGKSVQVTQKTRSNNDKTYVNVYVDKRIAPINGAPAEPEVKAEEDVNVDDLF
jgi:hypothetical protein